MSIRHPQNVLVEEADRDWLVGGGEMGDLIRSTDWSVTPLGPREGWSQSLRTIVSLVVESPFPKALLWGRDLILLYNDAYRVIAADRHPRALGRSSREIWPEVWHINEPIFSAVLERGESAFFENKVYPIDRDGQRQDAYFTISYSPVRVENNSVGGCLVSLLETTRTVQERHSLETERDSAEASAKRERELLSALVHSIPDEVWFADTQKRFTLANPAAQREFGLESGPVDVERLAASLEVLRPDGTPRPVDEAPPLRALTGETILNEEEMIRTPASGELRWRQVSASPVRGADGAILGSVSVSRDVTDRRRADEALRESEAKFRALFEGTSSGIQIGDLVRDDQGRPIDVVIADVNPAYERHMGLRRDQVVGRRIGQVLSKLEQVWLDRYDQLCRTGVSIDSVDYNAGQDKWWEVHASRLGNTRFAAIFTDVTEAKRAQEALEQSRRHLGWVLDATGIGLWLNELPLGKLNWDQRTRELFFAPPDLEPTIELFWSRVHPDDREQTRLAVEAAIRDHTLYTIEHRAVHPQTGEVRWIRSAGQATYDEGGNPIRFDGVNFDITDRKKTEEALRESEQRLRVAQAAGSIGAFEWNVVTGVNTWTPELERMYGLPVGSFGKTQQSWEDLLHPDDRAEAVARVEHAFETGEPEEAEFRIVRPDESVRWLLGRWQVVKDPTGKPLRLTGVNIDITERKRAEADLRRLADDLRDADRRKDHFLAVLSHELRNPLTPIRNSLYILGQAAPGGEQAKRAHAIIERQLSHLTRLVDDLLDATRIASGKMQFRHERLELGDLARRAVEDHRAVFAAAGVELKASVTTRPVWVHGDPTRLSQVIGNLLQNAVKFTPAAGHVEASLWEVDGDAVLRVTDAGMGIAPEMLERLFRPFVQAEQALDRRFGGLGLGLALAKTIIEHHGGHIEAASDGPGRGATFTVRLPLEAPETRESIRSPPAARRQRRRILIIEDNKDAADSLREVLELDGHTVVVAYGGVDGIKTAREFLPEVVLCDIGLPEMDGFAVARAFRGDELLKTTCLVALSGYALPEDLERAAEAGFSRHLVKPPSIEKLEQLLAELPEAVHGGSDARSTVTE